MKVLLIDPWGTNNTAEYLNGLILGLGNKTELTVVTNSCFELKVKTNATILKWFFSKTETMRHNKARSVLRGIEYAYTYKKIIDLLCKSGGYDVVHINWLLQYKLDIINLKIIKRYVKTLVYTAHNVIPHYNCSKKKIEELRTIYGLCNHIILHGENVKNEFSVYYPEFVNKIYIQKHGSNIAPCTSFDESQVSLEIRNKVKAFKRKYIYFGKIFYNKGVDRIIKNWNNSMENALLIVAGRREENYTELIQLQEELDSSSNILELNGFVDDNTLNYLIYNSDIILLPYRHASMSGVVFTAADFKKTLLCTNVGALPEYLETEIDSFVVENTDESIWAAIKNIQKNISDEELLNMGTKLAKNIKDKCAWETVVGKLIVECYGR